MAGGSITSREDLSRINESGCVWSQIHKKSSPNRQRMTSPGRRNFIEAESEDDENYHESEKASHLHTFTTNDVDERNRKPVTGNKPCDSKYDIAFA